MQTHKVEGLIFYYGRLLWFRSHPSLTSPVPHGDRVGGWDTEERPGVEGFDIIKYYFLFVYFHYYFGTMTHRHTSRDVWQGVRARGKEGLMIWRHKNRLVYCVKLGVLSDEKERRKRSMPITFCLFYKNFRSLQNKKRSMRKDYRSYTCTTDRMYVDKI